MANVTDKSILTAAGKALLAQLNAEEKALVIDKMIFANVPNRPEYPQPDDVVPSNDVVHEAAVEQRGRLSVDSVIYSTTLTSQEGPFEFNWTGAYCSEYGVLVTIDHHALTPKTADEPGVSGNTLVRSVVLEYKDIAEITNITVDASTWQYNATPRMKKMDGDVAQSIIDQNGKDWFIEDGFLVTPQASAFNIKAGAGYVSGNRVTLEFDRNVQVPNKPSFIYVDAHREGTPTGEQVTLFDFVVTADEKDDNTDANGVKHFVCKIAQVLADGSVSDLRPQSPLQTYQLKALAAVVRSHIDVNKERVSVTDFGAVADCFLEDGETINPNRTDNSEAFQAAINWCESTDVPVAYDRALYMPGDARGYWIPKPVRTSDEKTQFTAGTTRSLTIKGDGKSTILVGNGGAPANYTDGVNDGSDCILSIHRSNVIYENFQFRDTPVGLYMGQDPRSPVRSSHTNVNRGRNIWWQNCGTCKLDQPGKTNYNNTLKDFQMQGHQIGIHNALPFHHNDDPEGTKKDVSNRNHYSDFSINNGWAGILVENGDTCTLSNYSIESISSTANAVIGKVGPAPSQIHDGKATGIYCVTDKHPYGTNSWKSVNSEMEANDRDIYMQAYGWGFLNIFANLEKVEIVEPNGRQPVWVSTNSPYQSGKYAGVHNGHLHVKEAIGFVDPFLPTEGVAADDTGHYIPGGRISDIGGRPTEYDVAANCPQIALITEGTTKHSALGKIVTWSGKVKFNKPSSDFVNITLPNTIQIDNSSHGGLEVPVLVKATGGDIEQTTAKYLLSGNRIQISPPVSGWRDIDNELHINFSWRTV